MLPYIPLIFHLNYLFYTHTFPFPTYPYQWERYDLRRRE
jgi:hypothetical protein